MEMCLIVFRYNKQAKYPFIFVGNRDEAYERPSQSLHYWEDEPTILAGRDLKQYGTWLGVSRAGRFATLLNHPFTDIQMDAMDEPLSRGQLARSFLAGEDTIGEYLTALKETRHLYEGYHFLFGTFDNLTLYSNGLDRTVHFNKGLHSLSNNELNGLSQFKLERSKRLIEEYLNSQEEPELDHLISIFQDSQIDQTLTSIPEGVSRELAIQNTSMFVKGDFFGTVGTTAMLMDQKGQLLVKEVRYNNKNSVVDQTTKQLNVVL